MCFSTVVTIEISCATGSSWYLGYSSLSITARIGPEPTLFYLRWPNMVAVSSAPLGSTGRLFVG